MTIYSSQSFPIGQLLPASAGRDLSSHYTVLMYNLSLANGTPKYPKQHHYTIPTLNYSSLAYGTHKDPNHCIGFSFGLHKDPVHKTGFFLELCSQGTLERKGLHRKSMVLDVYNGLPQDPRLHSGFCLGVCRQGNKRKSMFCGSRWLAGNHFRKASTGIFGPASEFRSCTSAAWPKDRDAEVAASAEQSESANEELLLFFFQLDLTTRLQRALNLDQYEVAQQLREKLVEVDREISRQIEAKLGSTSSKDEAQDKAITILRLRNDLQKAVQEEDYGGAAELRDQISKLEAESLAAAAKALAYQNVEYKFRLGQKVRHTKFGYRGVVCGMDPLFSESDSWSSAALVKNLSRGKNQPFYQVLVDMRAVPNLMVAYVAEENLMPPKESDKDHLEHPYISFLFYGMDSAGDFIPIKQLREKYNKPRHELPWDEGREDDSTGGGGAKP